MSEHFVTLFDSKFMLSGLALHRSLLRHRPDAELWVVAADAKAEEQLSRLSPRNLHVVPLRELETAELLDVKPTRTVGEYCWTMTPFLASAILERCPRAERVTYLDADVYFVGDPRRIFEELERSEKDVLITEHAYGPGYDRSRLSGRFCVQFMTFRRSAGAERVGRWWQARCVEWCFARNEADRFGDQKYLDAWPSLFGSEVHILQNVRTTVAPWNVEHFIRTGGLGEAVFYHFQGFRILGPRTVKLVHGFRLSRRTMPLYAEYLSEIDRSARAIVALGDPVPAMPEHAQRWKTAKYAVMRAAGLLRMAELPVPLGTRPSGQVA